MLGSVFFNKEPQTQDYISWHQDITYWGLDQEGDVVTAWVALSPSTPESGCMRVVPGTHKREVVPHQDTFGAQNMLSRGQEIAVEVDEDHAVDLVLQPGQMSLHHVKIFHGSRQNRAADRRLASRSAICRPRSTSRSAPTARRWCAARTVRLVRARAGAGPRPRPRGGGIARGRARAAHRDPDARRRGALARRPYRPGHVGESPDMKLNEAQIREYHEQGYLFPIRALSPEAALQYRRKLEAFEAEGGEVKEGLRHKPHLLFTFLDELVRHPGVLDAVEGVIGPNILCWASSFFTKEPRTRNFISWHQD